VRIARTEDKDELLNNAGITSFEYSKGHVRERLKIIGNELDEKAEIIKKLLRDSKEAFG